MPRARVHFCTIALCWLATSHLHADEVDDFITAQMTAQNIPGLSLAVVRRGQMVKLAAYGVTDVADRSPVTPDTVFHIGSISKPFVAVAIMRLVQEGRLRLDDPVARYLDDAPDAWDPVTIRHLLMHTSGIVANAPGFDVAKDQDNAAVLRTAYALPLRFRPGERWEYSNTGFAVLGEIIGKVTGRAWHDYLTDLVFGPLGMSRTYPVNTKQRLANRARGYTRRNRQVDDWRALIPSGGLLSTVVDLAKWDAALRDDMLLTSAVRQQMWTAGTLNDGTPVPYGLGWEFGSALVDYGPIGQRPTVRHGGSLPGFRSEITRFADEGLTIIILMNNDNVDWRAILFGVARAYLPAGPVARLWATDAIAARSTLRRDAPRWHPAPRSVGLPDDIGVHRARRTGRTVVVTSRSRRMRRRLSPDRPCGMPDADEPMVERTRAATSSMALLTT